MITNDNQLITHDIFISYRRTHDKYPATATWSYLQNMGYDVWWDALLSHDENLTDINGEYAPIIDSMVANCTDFILLVSNETFAPGSLGGEKDWIAHELSIAMENNVHILPLLLDGAEIDTKNFPPEMPESIAKLLTKLKETNQIYAFPINLFQLSDKEISNRVARMLKSLPFKHASSGRKENHYAPDMPIEVERLKLQGDNTRQFDEAILTPIIAASKGKQLNVLDVGCGNGDVGFTRFGDPCFAKVLGIDKIENSINAAFDQYGSKNTKFKYKVLDVEDANFDDELERIMMDMDIPGFDVIFMSQVLHFHSPNMLPDDWMSILCDYLNPGGYLVVRESDDGSKMANAVEADRCLKDILEKTEALCPADRHMARQLPCLMKSVELENIKIHSFMRDTCNMTKSQRMELYTEDFGWRLEAISSASTDKTRQTIRDMEDSLDKLKRFFQRKDDDFWYCTYDYICVGQKPE